VTITVPDSYVPKKRTKMRVGTGFVRITPFVDEEEEYENYDQKRAPYVQQEQYDQEENRRVTLNIPSDYIEKRTHRIGTPYVSHKQYDEEEDLNTQVGFNLPQNYVEKRTKRVATPFVQKTIYDQQQGVKKVTLNVPDDYV